MEFKPERNQLVDVKGRPLTQSLFLEVGYDPDTAIYSLKEYHHEYDGKSFPSLKLLYLEMEDPTEYEFATTYFLSWDHWQRICNNKLFTEKIESWRRELELKIRSQAIRSIMDSALSEDGSFQAAKYLADKGWDKRGAGRPTKADVAKERKMQADMHNEFDTDVKRLFPK